jgi:alpha-D-ribose 1-methylphosphonate 5-triphosphate diphosphatase
LKNNGRSMVIENASIVTPTGVLENASLKVTAGIITGIGQDRLNNCDTRLDARGMYVLPGFIDLHSDAIEKEVQPRKGATFPVNMAIFEMDKKLAASGVTTIYHSISLLDNDRDVRNVDTTDRMIREIGRLAPKLNVRTRVHLRFDIHSTNAIPHIDRLIDEGYVQLLSIMDHTPGQGQFREITAYTKDYIEKYGLKEAEACQEIDRRRMAALPLQADFVSRIVKKCLDLGIPVASHDDDTREKLDIIDIMGISISEFPVNMEAVTSAAARGMHIAFGSPNVVRGRSISGNLSAREAILAGYGDILCSDYAPMSMIHAVFTIERMGIPIHKAVNMASLNPAGAAGISGVTGSLETGKSADLIIVDPEDELPRVLKTFVEGREIYSTWRAPVKYTQSAKEALQDEM